MLFTAVFYEHLSFDWNADGLNDKISRLLPILFAVNLVLLLVIESRHWFLSDRWSHPLILSLKMIDLLEG